MRTYARVQDGRVVELVATDLDISTMFHPALTWVDASHVTGISEGWTYDGSAFSRAVVAEIASPALSISGLQAQMAILATQLAALTKDV